MLAFSVVSQFEIFTRADFSRPARRRTRTTPHVSTDWMRWLGRTVQNPRSEGLQLRPKIGDNPRSTMPSTDRCAKKVTLFAEILLEIQDQMRCGRNLHCAAVSSKGWGVVAYGEGKSWLGPSMPH